MAEIHPIIDAAGVVGPGPSPRVALFWDGTGWLRALVDSEGRLQVRGEDQLHSFAGVLATTNAAALLANDGYVESLPCPAGQIWHVTNVWAADFTTATTRGTINFRHDGVEYPFHANPHARGISEPYSWHGHLWLDPSDTVRFYFIGGIIGDSCSIRLTGEIMTLET